MAGASCFSQHFFRDYIHLQRYNGFNLVVGDFKLRKLAYFSNRSGKAPEELAPGLFGISNGVLESHWPKVERGKARLKSLLDSNPDAEFSIEAVFQHVMGDKTRVLPEEGLPQTGLPQQLESQMSSIFLDQFDLNNAPYGTRSQTFLMVLKDGTAELHEKSLLFVEKTKLQPVEPSWNVVHHKFHCDL